jgi:hypothetical protein
MILKPNEKASLNIRRDAQYTQSMILNHIDIYSGRAFLPLLNIK